MPKKAPAPAPPPPIPAIVPPKRGPGRPRKAGPPQSSEQVRLAAQVTEAESRRDLAAATYATSKTVASEMGLLQVELETSNAWSAYLRSTGNHTHALKWSDQSTKFAARISALRELAAVDLLQELAARQRKEHAALGRVVK